MYPERPHQFEGKAAMNVSSSSMNSSRSFASAVGSLATGSLSAKLQQIEMRKAGFLLTEICGLRRSAGGNHNLSSRLRPLLPGTAATRNLVRTLPPAEPLETLIQKSLPLRRSAPRLRRFRQVTTIPKSLSLPVSCSRGRIPNFSC
jgi:hypothetical protein